MLDLRWGVEQRLAFIEGRLFWENGVNRSDLVAAFDISVPQASKDLALYQRQAPENLLYDKTRKLYVASDRFVPKFIEPDADAYLTGLVQDPRDGVVAEYLPLPRRRIDAAVLRQVVAARRACGSIEIRYKSMVAGRAGPAWRRITPLVFAHDGARWHVRAWCHERKAFLDFILSRCLAARGPGPAEKSGADDLLWNREFSVVLGANPVLTPEQQRVVAEDYGMRGGQAVLRIRQALLPYFDKRMRFDLTDYAADPRQASVIVKNRAEYEAALRQAEPLPD